MKAPIDPYFCQHLVLLVFLILVIVAGCVVVPQNGFNFYFSDD